MLTPKQTRKLERNCKELRSFVQFARNEHLHPNLERDAMAVLFANVNVIARNSSTNDLGHFTECQTGTFDEARAIEKRFGYSVTRNGKPIRSDVDEIAEPF